MTKSRNTTRSTAKKTSAISAAVRTLATILFILSVHLLREISGVIICGREFGRCVFFCLKFGQIDLEEHVEPLRILIAKRLTFESEPDPSPGNSLYQTRPSHYADFYQTQSMAKVLHVEDRIDRAHYGC